MAAFIKKEPYSRNGFWDKNTTGFMCIRCEYVAKKKQLVHHVLMFHRNKDEIPSTCALCGYISNGSDFHDQHYSSQMHIRALKKFNKHCNTLGNDSDSKKCTGQVEGTSSKPILEDKDYIKVSSPTPTSYMILFKGLVCVYYDN